MVRDPLDVVASAYVYHHRGEEPWNPMEKGIPLMAPEETGRVEAKAAGRRIKVLTSIEYTRRRHEHNMKENHRTSTDIYRYLYSI